MPLDFPSSPTEGQIYTDATSGAVYEWNSTYGYWSKIDIVYGAQVYDQANAAYNQANTAFSEANNHFTTGKSIAMSIVFG